jgi:hypothetical protein
MDMEERMAGIDLLRKSRLFDGQNNGFMMLYALRQPPYLKIREALNF